MGLARGEEASAAQRCHLPDRPRNARLPALAEGERHGDAAGACPVPGFIIRRHFSGLAIQGLIKPPRKYAGVLDFPSYSNNKESSRNKYSHGQTR